MSKPRVPKAPSPAVPAQPYEPTAREAAALQDLAERRRERAPVPAMKVVAISEGAVQLSTDHPSQNVGYSLLSNALGSASQPFTVGLVEQLANATSSAGQIQEGALNDALAIVAALQPQDEMEALMASQMALVHRATMLAARRTANSDNLAQLEANDRCLNRLTRTFAAQVDALKRYRTGGQQKMVVEHVTVEAGGQAIVGPVVQGGRGHPAKGDATP